MALASRNHWDSKVYPTNIHISESNFRTKVDIHLETAEKHNDENYLKIAREHIPIDNLKKKAALRLERFHSGPSHAPTDGQLTDFRDCLLLELIFWFKSSFFKWFDVPVCTNCQIKKDVSYSDGTRPLPEDIKWEGYRVELYECRFCDAVTRFPRYGHPIKLLETRIGRCGEWANCFTLMARALDFEARYVVDWTDHVWTEVYSEIQKRWLHCDPCENICDAPLLYEVGWGKKLSYILAVSKGDVQDVTWRYTANFLEVLRRRKLCREEWLVELIFHIRRQSPITDAKKKEIYEERLASELIELLTPKVAKENEKFGRISGSFEWRRERGEIGSQLGPSSMSNTFTPTDAEKRYKMFHLQYNIVDDLYIRKSNGENKLNKWEAGVYKHNGIFRKVESDWNMAYLARTEGTDVGEIIWKLDCSASELAVNIMFIKVSHSTFENGKVEWSIRNENKSVTFVHDGNEYKTTEFIGSKVVFISVKLSGGSGNNAWQHAQLFRQSTLDKTLCQFLWTVLLK